MAITMLNDLSTLLPHGTDMATMSARQLMDAARIYFRSVPDRCACDGPLRIEFDHGSNAYTAGCRDCDWFRAVSVAALLSNVRLGVAPTAQAQKQTVTPTAQAQKQTAGQRVPVPAKVPEKKEQAVDAASALNLNRFANLDDDE